MSFGRRQPTFVHLLEESYCVPMQDTLEEWFRHEILPHEPALVRFLSDFMASGDRRLQRGAETDAGGA
jgi:hypothetical protein